MLLVAPQAEVKGVSLVITPSGTECIALADRPKVDQILLNLLSNAVKFTNTGGTVTVACTAEGKTTSITVADTGVGIPPDKLDAIFEPFVQLGRSLSSAHEGTGLGLTITRRLVASMGGVLEVRSGVAQFEARQVRLGHP